MRKLIYILLGCYTGIYAQTGANPSPVNYNVDMYPKTPEAAALSKLVDIPAGSYTGVADFTIPLYTIDFDGEKIPIELRYTTTGVTVGQIATRVGLGWVLNTGPSLSQQVIGVQDRVFPRLIISDTFHPENNNSDYEIALEAAGIITSNGRRDIKPDIYTYSLLNGSGKFIMNAAGTAGIPMPYNQIKISLNYTSNEIVDEKGFRYIFGNPYPSSRTKNTCAETNPEFDYDDPNFKIATIKSPKNQEVNYIYGSTITSKYISSIMTQERVSIVATNPPPNPMWKAYSKKCVNKVTSNDQPLTEIQFNGGKVLFTYNNTQTNPRLDLDGEIYLTNVTVKNNKNETIKDFTLNYDYFTSVSPVLPNEIQSMTDYTKGLDKRLKLVSVKDNLTNGVYSLEYNETFGGKKLPIRVSNDQDFWGVYNGAGNDKKAISISRYNNVHISSEYTGADKNPDIRYGRLGNLNKIVYPTGGYSKIEYEADEFDLLLPEIVYDYQLDFPVYTANDTFPIVKTPIIIPENATNKMLSFVGNPNVGSTTSNDYCTWHLQKTDGTNHTYGQVSGNYFERDDPPGNYELWVTQDDNPNVNCNAEYTFTTTVATPIDTLYSRNAGTIRVKRIESVDNNNGKIVRAYTYKRPTPNHILPYTENSGVNQSEDTFMSMSTQKYPLGDDGYAEEVLVSNNPGWQTTTVKGKPVGYDYVQEHYIDETAPANSYRKEYKFSNEYNPMYYDPNTPVNVTWPYPGLDRGLVLEELLFDSANNLVRKTENEYQYDRHFNSKYASGTTMPYGNSMGYGLEIVPISHFGMGSSGYEFEYVKFPMDNYWLTEKKTTVTDYSNYGSDALQVVKNFKYSIPEYNHTYPIETSQTGSMGETLKTAYQYPQDIASGDPQYGIMQVMKANNQLSDPVITKNYTDNLVTSEVRTLYDQFNSGNDAMVLPKYIYLKKGENATAADRKITYDSYDIKGNLTQYTMEDGTPVSVIWGYDKNLPVAKIEGALFNDIKLNALVTTVVSASDNDNIPVPGMTPEQTEQALVNALDNLRKGNDFKNYQITTYSYDPLIGVRSVTPPSGIREYYFYDTSQRLQSIKIKEKDASGNEVFRIVKEFKYNYQQP